MEQRDRGVRLDIVDIRPIVAKTPPGEASSTRIDLSAASVALG